MIKIKSVPNNEDLAKLANSINEILTGVKNIDRYFVFEVDRDTLRKIDEEYYYKNKINDIDDNDFYDIDEVDVIISGVKFKFVANDEKR